MAIIQFASDKTVPKTEQPIAEMFSSLKLLLQKPKKADMFLVRTTNYVIIIKETIAPFEVYVLRFIPNYNSNLA